MASKRKAKSRMWYCRFHDERATGRTHVVGGTDDDGCYYSHVCHRPKEFVEVAREVQRRERAK